ncbi:MAG: hypothetical protein IT381_09780 [Deltaproteobacteria bacterium]|nr:hypothetical protein [Deltaproteobacteria bacterium]
MRRATFAVVLTTAVAFAAHAEAPAGGVTQKTDKGEVNWSQKTITVTGSGAFSNSASNAAQARLMAEKAAKIDAQRNLLETLKGVQVTSGAPAASVMQMGEVKTKVEGIVKNFEIVEKKYFNDGGVDVIVRMTIDGTLAELLIPDAGSKPAKIGPSPDGSTAMIIDAKGLGLTPALAPKVFDESGKEIYSAAIVSKDKLREHGVCAYARDLDSAKSDKRAGAKPLIVKATKLAQGSKNDLVIGGKDAAAFASAGYLGEGKLIIVVD